MGPKPSAQLADARTAQMELSGHATCGLASSKRLDNSAVARRQGAQPRRNVDAGCRDIGGASVAVFDKDVLPASGLRIMPAEAFNRQAMSPAGAGGQHILRIHAIANAPPGTDLPEGILCERRRIGYGRFPSQQKLGKRAVRVCDDLLHQFVAGLGTHPTRCDARLRNDLRQHCEKLLAVTIISVLPTSFPHERTHRAPP
jgi:hypothetical protein